MRIVAAADQSFFSVMRMRARNWDASRTLIFARQRSARHGQRIEDRPAVEDHSAYQGGGGGGQGTVKIDRGTAYEEGRACAAADGRADARRVPLKHGISYSRTPN